MVKQIKNLSDLLRVNKTRILAGKITRVGDYDHANRRFRGKIPVRSCQVRYGSAFESVPIPSDLICGLEITAGSLVVVYETGACILQVIHPKSQKTLYSRSHYYA